MDTININQAIEDYKKSYASGGLHQTPKLPVQMSKDDLRCRLTAAYCLEVERRGREFILDGHTQDTILRAARWACSSPKRWLLLMGTLGNGKSTMLRAIHRVFPYHSSLGDSQEIFDYFKLERGLRYWDEPILLIDDLGVEPARCMNYGEEHNPMAKILLHRYDRLKTTIIATNLGIDEIRERYGERVVDRMFEICEVIIYDCASYRRQ